MKRDRKWFNECRSGVIDVVGDLEQVATQNHVGHANELCESTRQAVRHALSQADLAQVRCTLKTARAATADRQRHDRHSITDLYALDFLAHFDNLAAELMAHDLTGGNEGALEVGVEVGSTDATVDDVHNDILWSRDGIGDLLDGELLRALEYCCLHRSLLTLKFLQNRVAMYESNFRH